MKNLVLVLMAVVCLYACSPSKVPLSSTPYTGHGERITESLFSSNEQSISEEDIRRILDGHIKVPDSARVALYNFASTSLYKYYSGYNTNEEFLKLKQNYIEALTSEISGSERVENIMLMPNLLTNKNPTLTNLRESAVRMQADLLIIFSIKSDIYYRYKMFKKDQAKAFATIETVLLDIRTGVAPYSSIITTEQLIVKESDLDIREMQKKAENQAILTALTESGEGLVEFLNQ